MAERITSTCSRMGRRQTRTLASNEQIPSTEMPSSTLINRTTLPSAMRRTAFYGGRRLTLRQNQKRILFSFLSSRFLVTLFKIFLLEYSQFFERYFLRHSLGATLRGTLRNILRGTLRGILPGILRGTLRGYSLGYSPGYSSGCLRRIFYEVLRKKKKKKKIFTGLSAELPANSFFAL